MHVKTGNFKINRTNKNLDRPRSEGQRTLSSCVSKGLYASGESGQGMMFGSHKPSELWGVQTRERAIAPKKAQTKKAA